MQIKLKREESKNFLPSLLLINSSQHGVCFPGELQLGTFREPLDWLFGVVQNRNTCYMIFKERVHNIKVIISTLIIGEFPLIFDILISFHALIVKGWK